ncbi:MAG TPA: prolipoprotein diacylglyceryl transferase [Cytophagaceae bacterium]
MSLLNYILWNVSPEIFSIGPLTVRWYGLLFATGFLVGQQILIRIYKQEGKTEKHVETLTIYMLIATIVGARLGHCLFYQPDYYLTWDHFIEILYIWEGGLASHGATVGILLGIYLYSKKQVDQSYLYVLDRLVIVIALAGALIRTGNLMNSEIIGTPSSLPTSFIFAHSLDNFLETNPNYEKAIQEVWFTKRNVDSITENGLTLTGLNLNILLAEKNVKPEDINSFVQIYIKAPLTKPGSEISEHFMVNQGKLNFNTSYNEEGYPVISVDVWGIPRHASQLYEAISSLLIFFLLLYIYNLKKGKTPEGRLFGLFVILIFGLRFLYEYFKEPQVDFEIEMVQTYGINMGQLLSIPLIIAGIFILLRSFKKRDEIV